MKRSVSVVDRGGVPDAESLMRAVDAADRNEELPGGQRLVERMVVEQVRAHAWVGVQGGRVVEVGGAELAQAQAWAGRGLGVGVGSKGVHGDAAAGQAGREAVELGGAHGLGGRELDGKRPARGALGVERQGGLVAGGDFQLPLAWKRAGGAGERLEGGARCAEDTGTRRRGVEVLRARRDGGFGSPKDPHPRPLPPAGEGERGRRGTAAWGEPLVEPRVEPSAMSRACSSELPLPLAGEGRGEGGRRAAEVRQCWGGSVPPWSRSPRTSSAQRHSCQHRCRRHRLRCWRRSDRPAQSAASPTATDSAHHRRLPRARSSRAASCRRSSSLIRCRFCTPIRATASASRCSHRACSRRRSASRSCVCSNTRSSSIKAYSSRSNCSSSQSRCAVAQGALRGSRAASLPPMSVSRSKRDCLTCATRPCRCSTARIACSTCDCASTTSASARRSCNRRKLSSCLASSAGSPARAHPAPEAQAPADPPPRSRQGLHQHPPGRLPISPLAGGLPQQRLQLRQSLDRLVGQRIAADAVLADAQQELHFRMPRQQRPHPPGGLAMRRVCDARETRGSRCRECRSPDSGWPARACATAARGRPAAIGPPRRSGPRRSRPRRAPCRRR
ncbi:hypothetical protein Ddc_22994 [Ditylenchus destructor]|nr:hypothetical protein Ddc_22994 [Ditylenchus destructor]